MSEMYEIESQTKYMVKVSQVKNIEDVDDVCYTRDELKEMGIEYRWGGKIYMRKKVRTDIEEWLGKIKKGNKSIKCDNEELIQFLKDEELPISDFVDGIRRVGNRISRYVKSEVIQKKPSYDNWLSLVYVYEYLVEGLDIRISYNNCDKVKFVKSLKKLMSWEEVCEEREHLKDDKWVKELYDNPESY